MKRVKFSGAKNALKGKGFVIALALSVTTVGVSTYLAYNQAISKIGGFESDDSSSENEIIGFDYGADDKSVNKLQEGVEIDRANVDEETAIPSAEIIPEVDAEEANNFIGKKSSSVMPVDGEIIIPFSNGELVKSKTLGVWKTHDGIDIKAEPGTPVVSMMGGVVDDIFSDPLWGVSVVIDHGDGIIGYYFSLDKSISVVIGQEIGTGDLIGTVGNTAEIEIAEESHLHFAVKKNGDWIDPLAIINN